MGALRAFDLLAVNRTVNDFDIYVGTSAGAFVASMVANGVTPEEMFRVLDKALPSPIENASLRTLLRPNYKGFANRLALLPLRIAATARRLAGNIGEISMVDVVMGLAEGLPTGIYHNRGIEKYVRNVLSDPDRTNDFRELDADLRITATDLDTCERIVFGEGEWDDVPISRAVAASGALPIVYEPYELRGRQLVDGGIVSTTNVDVAVEAGAKFIVVVNPLVPYVNDFETADPDRVRLAGAPRLRHGHAGDRKPGLPAARPRPPAPRRPVVEGALPGRRHHPDRARVRRRADVRHLDPRLLRPPADRQARLRVRDRQAGARLPALQGGRGPARDRDLRAPGAARPRHGRGGGEGDLGLAARARADHRRAAAPVRRG